MADAVRIKFDDSKAQAGLDKILRESQEALRPAIQAGIEELYFETRMRCPVSDKVHRFYGSSSRVSGVTYDFKPGNLRDSIYQVFSKDNSVEKGPGYKKVTYHVAWNHKKAPYGFMVEFGTSRAPAHPFLRPAYDARKEIALQVAKAVLVDRISEVVS